MKTATENYVLSGTGVNIPVPHDCEIRDVREENDYLVIDFEDVSEIMGTVPCLMIAKKYGRMFAEVT